MYTAIQTTIERCFLPYLRAHFLIATMFKCMIIWYIQIKKKDMEPPHVPAQHMWWKLPDAALH